MDFFLEEDERFDEINENLKIIQKKNGLTFGSDTYLLSAFISEQPGARAADLGSGTGIASLLCASKGKFAKIYAAEVQEKFFELIGRNSSLNGLDRVITPICSDVRELRPADVGGELDAVFSNPPYMKSDSGRRNLWDEKYIARHEVCGDIGDFCSAAARLLKFGGLFYCVYRPDRLSDLMAALRASKLEPKVAVFVYPDASTAPSAVLIRAKKGAASSMKLCRPLIIHSAVAEGGGARPMTEDAKKIYESCSFEEFLSR